jgi:hypothetical protein
MLEAEQTPGPSAAERVRLIEENELNYFIWIRTRDPLACSIATQSYHGH